MPSRPVGFWARAATREGLPDCRWPRCPGGAHSPGGPGQSGRIAILITRPPSSAGFNMALKIRCTPSMSALHVAVVPVTDRQTARSGLRRGRPNELFEASVSVPHTRHPADPRRQTSQGRDNRRSVACKSPGPAAFCLGVLGVVAGTGRLVEVAPGEEVQVRVFGGRSRHWLGRWVEEVSGGGVGSVEVGAGRARGVGPRVGGRAA
jgi:hypothetical protein